MLANHDQNKCYSCFRLAQSVWVNVKLESSGCKSFSDFRLGSIDRRTSSIDRQAECYFLQISNSTLAYLKRLGFYIFAPGK